MKRIPGIVFKTAGSWQILGFYNLDKLHIMITTTLAMQAVLGMNSWTTFLALWTISRRLGECMDT